MRRLTHFDQILSYENKNRAVTDNFNGHGHAIFGRETSMLRLTVPAFRMVLFRPD